MIRSISESTIRKKASIKTQFRNISKYLDKGITCKAIRQTFLDYFINDCNHNFVRSSPVVPLCDPSVAFINAGMNQFKGILLGTQTPEYRKVANSQKCIRVGGKHNDLNVVGLDGYHHTFFEMLGNWSFGDYFKKEACELAWNLLTKKYKINENILYVTYFAGDDSLALPPDLECRDIWRTIGIPEERILPFGTKDNFWEMGPSGPCGPCTEIHVDLLLNGKRAEFVNKGLPDLTELWNIVFIQYNRSLDGSIHPLPQKHIDTGMGLERLVALLQGKISNYDTDIFTNILSAITKSCKGIPGYGGKFGEHDWNNLDTHYRILSDHSRMIIASLADGIIPEQNQKLRRIMRRAFQLSGMVFKRETGLLKELSNYVVENLGSVYPEMERNIKQIHQVIEYEEQLYKILRDSSASEWKSLVGENTNLRNLDIIEMPGLIAAYKDIKCNSVSEISSEFGFRLYDTYGLNEQTISKLSKALNIGFDAEGFRQHMQDSKLRNRSHPFINDLHRCIQDSKLTKTDNSYKYEYKKDEDKNFYVFDKLDVRVLKVFVNNTEVDCIEPGIQCSVLLDKSNLYYEAGGQVSDKGTITFNNKSIFEIDDLVNLNGYILHRGVLKSNEPETIPLKTQGKLAIDEDWRLSNMKNHTAAHLLNSALKKIKGTTYQKSSTVNPIFLNLDVGIFGPKFSVTDVVTVEHVINSTIDKGIGVNISEVDSQKLLSFNDVTLIPGEIYPESGIRLIEIDNGEDLLSREPCCGTHVLNTADLEDFCIIDFDSLGRSTVAIFGVTGERAKLARNNGIKIITEINNLNWVNENKNKVIAAIKDLRHRLNYTVESSSIIPVTIKYQCLELLKAINSNIKRSTRNDFKNEIQNILKQFSKSHQKYIVHHLSNEVPLHTATSLCHNVPVILLSYSNNKVKARCCVPKHLKNDNFDARQWLSNSVGLVLNSSYAIPEDEDLTLVCNMKTKRINKDEWNILLKKSVEAAEDYAQTHLR